MRKARLGLGAAALLFVLIDCTPLRLLARGKGLWRRA